MSKAKEEKKKKQIEYDMAFFKKRYGAVTLGEGDSFPYRVPFSHKGLQLITGGLVGGHMSEFSGPSYSGKSFLGYECLANTVNLLGGRGMLIDGEGAFEPSYGRKVGLVTESDDFLLVPEQLSMEDSFEAMRDFVMWSRQKDIDNKLKKPTPVTLMADSYSGMKLKLDLEAEEAKKDPSGYIAMRTAAYMSEKLTKFVPFLKKTGANFILINQLTKERNPVTQHVTIKSKAEDCMAYWSTLRLRGSCGRIDGSDKRVVKEVKSIDHKDKKVLKPIGLWSTWESIKNRTNEPFKKVQVKVIFSTGINPISGLAELLINEERIRLATKAQKNAKGQTLKTRTVGFVVENSDDETFYAISDEKSKLNSKDVENAILKLIEENPSVMENIK